jgi:hypothetical protein
MTKVHMQKSVPTEPERRYNTFAATATGPNDNHFSIVGEKGSRTP